ncbi:hypothetical protein QYE76_002781 [Lolium multiflorum]|uniref:RNase H type-1 domain-containing protein n=1 Tax=Lolium multiflorum TaxID=4521 RepID=A0AAD8RRB6_LOLMU|nr:hypothetical protein QYE76_002781 [Lolium multiflorum]
MSGRRFLNLLVGDVHRGVHSLHRFDLSRNQFFYTKSEAVAASRARNLLLIRDPEKRFSLNNSGKRKKKKRKPDLAEKIDTFRLPAPLMSMRPTPCHGVDPWRQDQLHCFSLSENNFMFADLCGRMFSYDTDSSCFVTMPTLHAPKESPLALTISLEDTNGVVGSIYIIEEVLRPGKSHQFEALFVHPCLGGGRQPGHLRVSVVGIGTYCFDTVSHAWSRAGGWLLPFCGMAEHVPEFNLWFGISAHNTHLPWAADLSSVLRGQPPEQSFVWEDAHLPEDWYPCPPAQMVSLGCGRFFIARFFQNMVPSKHDVDRLIPVKTFAVLTGLEVLASKGKDKAKTKSNGSDSGDGHGNSGAKWYGALRNALSAEALTCRDGLILAQHQQVTNIHLKKDCEVLIELWKTRKKNRAAI